MTSSELRELVKAHFSLVEAPSTEVTETFGRIADENGAFEIEFPGDSLQIGDKVTVVTSDDQRMNAPDGEHRLADGTRIVTKDSVVEEIISADDEKELAKEEMAEEEVIADVAEEVISEVVEDKVEEAVADAIEEVSIEEVVTEIAKAMEEEMGKMKQKMAELEEKVASVLDAPAAEATIVKPEMSKGAKFSRFDVNKAANQKELSAALKMIKNKK